MSHQLTPIHVTVVRWIARLLGACMFLLWGSFFIHHMEWFMHPDRWPPPKVFLFQFLHLVMLLALLAAWRWELIGSIAIVLSAVAFFSLAGGPNAVPFILITSSPAILWFYCIRRTRSGSLSGHAV